MTTQESEVDVVGDGGPAFPEISTSPDTVGSGGDYQTYGNVQSSGGMTLRDYFAAKAMQGDWAAQDSVDVGLFSPETDDAVLVNSARLYYRMADAMLAARAALRNAGVKV